MKQGFGRYIFKETGAIYSGFWNENLKHGKGELIYPKSSAKESVSEFGIAPIQIIGEENQMIMRGLFENDSFIQGELHDQVGNVFSSVNDKNSPHQGFFQNDRLCGFGRCIYSGGDKYQGFFQGGKRSGQGTMIFSQFTDLLQTAQEATYEGNWKLNMRNGYGVMTWPDGTVFEGEWLNDERHSGKQVMTDQNIYEGQFQNDKPHGIGKITYTREQIIFEGLFQDGK